MTLPFADSARPPGAFDLPPDAEEADPAYRRALAWIWSFSDGSRPTDEVQAHRALRMPRMRALLERLGDPQRAFPSVMVAGTKGKGSVVAMAAACLHAAGLRTGAYTSPHLVNWRERTCVEGRPIGTDDVVDLAGVVRAAVDALPASFGIPSTFEVGTALTFLFFARQRVDAAVVEVGVGGSVDATNVLEPLVSAITPISLDHVATLGPTLASIAAHKAGIMRAGRPAVLGPQPADALVVLEETAARTGARLVRVGRDWTWRRLPEAPRGPGAPTPIEIVDASRPADACRTALPLLGEHQGDNAAVAAAVVAELWRSLRGGELPPTTLARGLESVVWPGRLQVLGKRPWIVVDGAHNAASAHALRLALDAFPRERLHLVLGLTEGKDVQGVLRELLPAADRLWLTRSQNGRALEPASLLGAASAQAPRRPVESLPDLPAALDAALAAAGEEDLVVVTGSLFLVGEAIVWARRRRPGTEGFALRAGGRLLPPHHS